MTQSQDMQVYEILEELDACTTKQRKVDLIRTKYSNHTPLQYVLRWNFDNSINSLLPEGEPPFDKEEKDGFFVTYNITEGPQFTIGEVRLSSNVKEVSVSTFKNSMNMLKILAQSENAKITNSPSSSKFLNSLSNFIYLIFPPTILIWSS